MRDDDFGRLDPFAEADRREKDKKADAEREKRIDDALASVLNSASGRMALAYALELTDIEGSSFDSDPLRMAWQAGRRDVGIVFLARLRAVNPELVRQMQKEAEEDGRN